MMKLTKIDHIGIAVPDMSSGAKFWTEALGLTYEAEEIVAEQKVKTAFLPVGESEVELLESTDPDGPVAKFIEKRGPGFQHIAFRVDDIDAALAELKEKDIALIDQEPRKGAGGARIIFIHPKATGGILVELCERGDGTTP
jgi:methylmalonyl-CoA/ethylmalonyl-CoA epimerase